MTQDTLGARVSALIAATGMSRRAWGEQHGWSRGHLDEIIHERKSPRLDTLQRLARDLGTSLSELLDGLDKALDR